MTAPLTMREIMSETGHTLISPDVLTRAEDLALTLAATGTVRCEVWCKDNGHRIFMRPSRDGNAVAIDGEFMSLDAAEEVAITLLALVAVARRDVNG